MTEEERERKINSRHADSIMAGIHLVPRVNPSYPTGIYRPVQA